MLKKAETLEGTVLPDGTALPGRTYREMRNNMPEPDWRKPFEA